ncbi:hypothetical protein [Burkholderia gladioli]|uniref:hypothetical protein n=1 Tax=Burkholderia gladioli TaxID=28095 RepID=UPI001641FF5C|nr:hypothetical protein [Burkholderia gladioli]
MQQLGLFEAEGGPQTFSGKASADVARASSLAHSLHDEMPENSHVHIAISNGWWGDALALIRHKDELHQQIRSEMILAAEDRCPGLGEIRQAVRLIVDRIAGLIDGPLDNEHVIKAREVGWWQDFELLQAFQSELHRSSAAARSARAPALQAAVLLLNAKLSLLRRQFH